MVDDVSLCPKGAVAQQHRGVYDISSLSLSHNIPRRRAVISERQASLRESMLDGRVNAALPQAQRRLHLRPTS